ncbi:hypothetical protein EBR43_12665 [bacterium]|nr:hypothetical protein [bacterium]
MYELLSSYKKVDSYGNLFNNVGAALRGSEQAKINVLKDYKFTIAFENSYHPGYNTEKIIQPLSVNCIPLYWGGDSIRHYFNMDKIIYANDYAALESVLDKVVELDTNDSLYEKMAKMSSVQPAFYDFKPEKILEKIKNKLQI